MMSTITDFIDDSKIETWWDLHDLWKISITGYTIEQDLLLASKSSTLFLDVLNMEDLV